MIHSELIFFIFMRIACFVVFAWFCWSKIRQHVIPQLYESYRAKKETEKEQLLTFNKIKDNAVLLYKQKLQMQEDTIALLTKLEKWQHEIALKEVAYKEEAIKIKQTVRSYNIQQSCWLSIEYTRQKLMPQAFSMAKKNIITTFSDLEMQHTFLKNTINFLEQKSCS